MTPLTSALIGGGTKLLGGLMGGDNDWANRANVNLSMANLYNQQNQYAQNRKDQRTFAKKSTGWKLRDMFEAADQSGIHRLAVLGGASGNAYQPVQSQNVGGSFSSDDGDAFIGDAIGEGMEMAFRQQQYNDMREDRDLDNQLKQAEIDLVKSQSRTEIAKARRIGTSPETDGIRQALDPTDHTATHNNRVVDARPDANLRPIVMEDGTVQLVPVGPDIDEVIVGGVLYAWNKAKQAFEPRGPAHKNQNKRNTAHKDRVVIEKKNTTGSSSRKDNR